MKLADWLQINGITQRAFAEQIGVTQGRISQICAAGTDSLSTASKIEEATQGAVTATECRQVSAAEARAS